METREIRHFHMCCGIGGGARGANKARADIGILQAAFRCIGGVDNSPAAVRNFKRLAGVEGTVLDLFSRAQYVAFHGHEPPPGWREATPEDLRRAAGYERPHVVLASFPCKGFSGLLSNERSLSPKYQALNELAVRCVDLALEAWADDPPEFFLLENVPRILTRGRGLLDVIAARFARGGYAWAETTHDCGEFGKLSQSRKRFLGLARFEAKVPTFLYEPVKHPLQSVGKLLETLPLPGDTTTAGPMHRIPSLQWLTWLRLAFVVAGRDWRSLKDLAVQDGVLRDYAIVPDWGARHSGNLQVQEWTEPSRTVIAGGKGVQGGQLSIADPRVPADTDWHPSVMGVRTWDQPAHTVTGESRATNGAYSVADPRIEQSGEYAQLGVREWSGPTGAVTGQSAVGGGAHAVADPRLDAVKHNNCFRIVRWDEVGRSVTGGTGPSAGGVSVADPRLAYNDGAHQTKFRVCPWGDHARTVTGADQVQGGALSVADPRCRGEYRDNPYGVLAYDTPAGTVTGSARYDNGFNSVADPRLPAAADKLVCIIRSLDGTWHRPFTTYELAALQGYVDPGVPFELDGNSDAAWREGIGNGIPDGAMQAVFSVIGQALLLSWTGETFVLGATPIWVRDVAVAISVAQRLPEVLH